MKYFEILSILEGGSMVTAAHVVDYSAKIVINRPDLQEEIITKLLDINKAPLDEDIETFSQVRSYWGLKNIYNVIKNKYELIFL